MRQRKFTNEEIIAAYQKTGSVWRAAKELGACGQSVWERLKRLGYQMSSRPWDSAETEELRSLAPVFTISEIAERLGRSYSAIASKISLMQIGQRYGNRLRTKTDRGRAIGESAIRAYFAELNLWNGSARQFCFHKGIRLERFVIEAQRHMPDDWNAYVRSSSDLKPKPCQQCSVMFIPMTGKQSSCSRKCAMALRIDKDYFGGRRSSAAGIIEGVCQLCGAVSDFRMAAHHVYGKENDPNHDAMIAVCNGCHSLIGTLAGNPGCGSPEFLEGLISWALARHYGSRRPVGFHVTVDIEELTETDAMEEFRMAGSTEDAPATEGL